MYEMFIFKEKKKEQDDELHREYGVLSNCGYITVSYTHLTLPTNCT